MINTFSKFTPNVDVATIACHVRVHVMWEEEGRRNMA